MEGKGLIYAAYSDISGSAGEEPGEFIAYMRGGAPENTAKAIGGLLAEIKRIRNQPVSDQELEDSKSHLTGSYYFGLQGSSALTNYLLLCETYHLGFDFINRYPGNINQVTKKMCGGSPENILTQKRIRW